MRAPYPFAGVVILPPNELIYENVEFINWSFSVRPLLNGFHGTTF